jgi:hypothetical protein
MIYITGDKHGDYQLDDLSAENWPEGQLLCKDDYLIIAGDFGGVFHGGEKDKRVLDYYESCPWTTLFIDGNHENFDMLSQYPVTEWNGGKAQFIRSSVIHLMRGQVYTIDNKTIFTMGGATSVDKDYRVEGESWWKEELPSGEELFEADKNLAKYDNKVDIAVTHCCSARQYYKFATIHFHSFMRDSLTDYLDELEKKLSFRHWYYGHHHEDINVDETHTMVCRKVISIED